MCSVFCFALTGHAQLTIDDFTSAPAGYPSTGWTSAISTSGGLFTVGTGALDDGTFQYAPNLGGAFNASSQTFDVTVTARIDAGNTATGFVVVFFDAGGTGTRSAAFSSTLFTSTLTTQTLTLGSYGGGDAAAITLYGIAGIGAGDKDFRFTFDSITVSPTAVPEPATYAMFAGVLTLGFVVWRRRQACA